MTIRAHRFVAAGALAVAAVAAPIAISLSSGNAAQSATGPCLAWYGNKEDGICLGYSNGNPTNVGTPFYNGGNSPNSGVSTGPVLPNQTWNAPIGGG
jgi:hypothetical protein